MTRKELLGALRELEKSSRKIPIKYVRFSRVNNNQVDTRCFFFVEGMDRLLDTLMDESLTCSVAKIKTEIFIFDDAQLVDFWMLPTKDYTTNIDAKVMEMVVKLNVDR